MTEQEWDAQSAQDRAISGKAKLTAVSPVGHSSWNQAALPSSLVFLTKKAVAHLPKRVYHVVGGLADTLRPGDGPGCGLPVVSGAPGPLISLMIPGLLRALFC